MQSGGVEVETMTTDVLILGSGGAGLFAALHAAQAAPELDITIVAKGLFGRSGCTRMVQGGYNVALHPDDSIERHFMDTIIGGDWLPRQDLAWQLCQGAVERIRELENELGCFFDRNPDGTLHQKAFAGQSFDRTAHRSDLTGIEIISRLLEKTWAMDIRRLEEHRAVELVVAQSGDRIAGALLVDIRSGRYRLVRARAVLLGTGAGPTMYRYHTPSGDKSCDGLAMALRCGLGLRDMEMVQFHPTGVLAGDATRMTGTILEEGLRGAGGYLLNGAGERFMENYHAAAERATRDIVSRAMYNEMRAGRTTPQGGLYIEMAHLGADRVRRLFPGMVRRCADCGFDLAAGRVEVVPTAHYMMGGVEMELDCSTALPGLYVAGEDAGGIHGANRLGGNGVANSTVFGGIAGTAMAGYAARCDGLAVPDEDLVARAVARCEQAFAVAGGDMIGLRETLANDMWEYAGIVRHREELQTAIDRVVQGRAALEQVGVADGDRAFNLGWQEWLNLDSLLQVSEAVCRAALAREDSRGAHFRADFPQRGNLDETTYTRVLRHHDALTVAHVAVDFSLVKPGQSLLDNADNANNADNADNAVGVENGG